jgi:hypothetical protein
MGIGAGQVLGPLVLKACRQKAAIARDEGQDCGGGDKRAPSLAA